MQKLENTVKSVFEKYKRKTAELLKQQVHRYQQKAHDFTIDELKKIKETNFFTKLITYGTIGGLLTGSKQKDLAKEVGVKNLEFTEWSILFGFMLAYAKYFGGEMSEHIPFVGNSMNFSFDTWANITSAANLYRFCYIKATKNPISSLYVWLAYSAPKAIIMELEKEIKPDKTTNLQ